MKAACSGCGRSTVPRPSRVVISDCPSVPTGVMQERTGAPSTSTVQAPHWASPQPNLAALRPRSLRSTYSSGVSGLAGTLCVAPFTLMLMAIAEDSPGPCVRTRCILLRLLSRVEGPIRPAPSGFAPTADPGASNHTQPLYRKIVLIGRPEPHPDVSFTPRAQRGHRLIPS